MPSPPSALRPLLNDLARAALGLVLALAGVAFTIAMRLRAARFREAQRALARRYGIGAATPIRPFDAETRDRILAFAAAHPDARFATTSGSTGEPKRVAYTRARLALIKRENVSALARILLETGGARASLFILSSLKEEGSLASLLTSGRARPSALEAILVPTRLLAHPAIEPLVDRYGATAVRVVLLALANPGLVYSTNPSTLAVLLEEIEARWERSAALARDLVERPGSVSPEARAALAGTAGLGGWGRLARVAASRAPLPLLEIAPGIRAFCAWDGGYVRPFLDQIRRRLPEGRVAHVPMYAMSTETLMTMLVYERGLARFLPLAPGVLTELLPEGAPDDPAHLVPPWRAAPGRAYAFVASDAFGLRRYQTDDLFLCRGRVMGLPDLAFQRRRGLSYSFTGEKLTGEEVERALRSLEERRPPLAGARLQMGLAPSLPEGALLPRYRLLLAHAGDAPPPALARALESGALTLAMLARDLDEAISEANAEWATKRRSGRLAPPDVELLAYDALAARLDRRTASAHDMARRTWESQWKLLPLQRVLWEASAPPPAPGDQPPARAVTSS